MSPATQPPTLSRAARDLARAAGLRRPGPKKQVPRLRVADRQTGPPTLWMVCPDWNVPSGGLRKQYRAVDVLNDAGLTAAVVHKRSGFRCTWFEHTTRIVSAADITVGPRDVIAVPEVYGTSMSDLPRGVRQVIFNQGAYLGLEAVFEGGDAAAAPYRDNPDLAAVVVVSEDSAAVVGYMFPEAPVQRIKHGLDPAVHHPPVVPPGRQIAYMPRRRRRESEQVLRLLELRGALKGWSVVPISHRTEHEVADILRASRVFLSFSQLEGFGLPPLEALACGSLVVGFNGFGGRELFRDPFAVSVEDGDVVGFARAAEAMLRRIEDDPVAMEAAAAEGSRFALESFSRAVERQSLLDAFVPLLIS